MNDIVSVVSKTAKSLILKEPFYGLLLSGLNKVYTTAIPTAAVTKQNIGFALLINPEFFLSLNEKEREGVLKHELIHIGFSHLVMFQTFRNKEIFNIAADQLGPIR